MAYKPLPFNVVLTLQTPKTITAKGSTKKTYVDAGEIYCSFRTFGGTETTSNGALTVENTAVVDTWYNPEITADSRVITADGGVYEILGTPENIEMHCQFMRFKIREIRGGV